jgi:UDP-3-O-[3-hydroxymyristoyl] glucosamine N-acyltransferase
MFAGVAPLQSAGQDEVSFLDNRRYAAALERTMAGAVIVHPQMEARVPSSAIAIVTASAYEAWARVAALFHPAPPTRPGVHPSALIDPDAQVDASAEIGPYAVVEARAEIGPGCRIGSFVSIGAGVTVGRDCRIGAHASLSHALIGSRVYIYPGARIGQEGFSFAATEAGFLSIPQLGRVIVEDDVEIGANTTIDRGALDDTVIGDGVKLDNQIQVAHNCVIGAHTVIAGCTGISGSVTIGRDCMIGGGVGIVGHISICDRVTISGMTLVAKPITQPGTYTSGLPMMPHAQWLRSAALLRRLERIAGRPAGALPGEDREPDDDH